MIRRAFIKPSQLRHSIFSANKPNVMKYTSARVSNRFFNASRTVQSPSKCSPRLPILEEIAKRAIDHQLVDLKNVALIGIQHLLPTTASLFDVMMGLGLKSDNIFLAGKFYSTCRDAANYMQTKGIQLMPDAFPERPAEFAELMRDTTRGMWKMLAEHLNKNQHINKVIILDEGGHCIESMPKWLSFEYAFASIEQTRFGLYSNCVRAQSFPLINVAGSAAKKCLESPLIAKAVLRRIKEVLPELSTCEQTIFGVVGNGAIGSAIAQYLLGLGYKVVVYDGNENAFHNINHRNCYRVGSIQDVIARSDIVFGCTGRDITKGLNVLDLVKDKITLISASSQDIEFSGLLQSADKLHFSKLENGALPTLTLYGESKAKINILERGFPINFDRTPASDPVDDMELTRGLLLGGFIQAVSVATKPIGGGATINKGSNFMLDPDLQKFVAQRWLNKRSNDVNQLTSCFDNVDWIIGNSGGVYQEDSSLRNAFADECRVEEAKISALMRV